MPTDTPAATARRLIGLPLRTVAERSHALGCPMAVSTISQLERGRSPITAERLVVLRAIYLQAARKKNVTPKQRAAVREAVAAMVAAAP